MDNVFVTIAIEAGTGIAIVAGVRTALLDLKERVDKVELWIADGPKNYVPRSELEAMFKGILDRVGDIKEMLLRGFGVGELAPRSLQASAAEPMTYSSAGYTLTEGFEALRLTAYPDQVGVLTIGWGHTGRDVYTGETITYAQAVDLLERDTAAAVACVNQHLQVALSQHQFDALVDFVFNEGTGHFLESSLFRELNAGNYTAAADHFADWVMAGGKRVGGLERRRAAEDAMFLEA